MTNTMTSHKYLYKEQAEEQVGGEKFTKENNLGTGKWKN